MSRLKVLLRGALISEIELNPEKEYIGGRKDGSDIRLQAEKGISREHFKLKMIEGRWNAQAISRFGEIFSLGQKIEEITLEHGQIFQIPPYEFQLLDVPEADIPEHEAKNIDFSEITRTVMGAAPQVPYIKMVNSKDQVSEMLRLEVGDLWVAGRDPSCQIVIPDQRVSRRQFEIHKTNGIFTILDLGSVNGTFLNGASVSSTDPVPLKSGDAITVLDNTMYFELHDPNFKFKIEKIDIPSIPLDFSQDEGFKQDGRNNAENSPGQYPVEIPLVEQESEAQLNTDKNGSPFTGLSQNNDKNKFFNFTTPNSTQAPTGFKKVLANKPLLIAFCLVFLGVAAYFGGFLNSEEPLVASAVKTEGDAFAKLTPKQQTEITEMYSLADQMMAQQKYDLALEKIRKIHEILPSGYKESKAIQTQAEQSLLTIVQQQEDEKRVREEEEQKKMFLEVAAKCEKMLVIDINIDKIKECLVPIASIDPTNSEYVRILSKAEKLDTDKKIKQAEQRSYGEQVEQLKKMFALAEKNQNAGFAFKAIKYYRSVVDSTLPDPDKLKSKAIYRVSFIEKKVAEKTQNSITQADSLFQEGKLKQSVLSLRESLIYDPNNKKVKEKIDTYTNELRRQMMILYQESVIDESYGIVDNSETREGAKGKWKKIVETDLEDGDYFKKAILKLRKYGVM